ncbi:hypothetical protein HHK36_016067 [Tetracentron sinense]|uniref:Uncharacterized protein n=1 Tax=Tetracentron sinense TaxID=13715 RepID=A0A834YZ25_TETSI|nr:hypothetical protein HHK36_016067 [Tetracentron sinense]
MAITHPNPSFLVERKEETELVKPSEPTPLHQLSLSTIDNDPSLNILCQSIYVYRANDDTGNGNNHDYRNFNSDPISVVKEALSKVLVYYYPLAGKIKRHSDGKLRVDCTAEGVPFSVATASCKLSSLQYLNGVDVKTLKHFVYDMAADGDNEVHPLVMQVTQFSCGGFTIGLGIYHSVCDGSGAAQFFRAMAEIASGKSKPSVKPVWERERLVVSPTQEPFQLPMSKDSLATSPYLPTTDFSHECFDVSSESIRRLKMGLMKESGIENFTTVEAIGAYVWRSRLRALEMNLDGETSFCLAVGIRRLLDPPLPEGYYGNAFVGSNLVLKGRDLNEGPLSRVVRLIKESKKNAYKIDHIWSWIAFLDRANQLNMEIEASGSSMILTDWRQLGLFEDVDFGWKGVVNMIPVPVNFFGHVELCIFLPPFSLDLSMKGGLRVLVCLPRAAMAKFKEEMNALQLEEHKALI